MYNLFAVVMAELTVLFAFEAADTTSTLLSKCEYEPRKPS